MIERLTLKIIGDVQGVNFRYYTRERARELQLAGWVRNTPEGAVAVVAEGARPALDQLLDWCRRGPGWARVERVEERWDNATGEFSVFEMRW